MATRTPTQNLINRIVKARRAAGLTPERFTPERLTLQQVEAQADSLHITPEALLIEEVAA